MEATDVRFILSGSQLSYVGQEAESIPGIIGRKYGKVVKILDLSYNQLRTLNGLYSFENLEELVLDNNQLGDDMEIPELPQLHTLTLNKNKKFTKECLKMFHELCWYYLLYRLPRLQFLDSRPVTKAERQEAQRVGQYMKIASPTAEEMSAQSQDSVEMPSYTPLPRGSVVPGDHKGTFGRCRYIYYGKHSEGNRFIRNNEL